MSIKCQQSVSCLICGLVHISEITFPKKGVRFIAINDGVDSAQGENDMSALRNLFKNKRRLGGGTTNGGTTNGGIMKGDSMNISND